MRSVIKVRQSDLRNGNVSVGGYKHAAVLMIAAAIIIKKPIIISNVPHISDTIVLTEIIKRSGGTAVLNSGRLYLDTRSMYLPAMPGELTQLIHGSLYLIPAYLSAFGQVAFDGAGGCQIGSSLNNRERPIHHILSVVSRFGPQFKRGAKTIEGQCKSLEPTVVDIRHYSDDPAMIDGPLVSGATKTAILCGLAAHGGETHIQNPYLKADVLELLRFASSCGYDVYWTNSEIRIRSRSSDAYGAEVCSYDLMSCVTEVMTYIALSVHLGIRITLTDLTSCRVKQGIKAELSLLEEMGLQLDWSEAALAIEPVPRVQSLTLEVTSTGIFSDHHPFFTLMLLRGRSPSTIRERVWRERFDYVDGLKCMGANIDRVADTIRIFPSRIGRTYTTVAASDLRAAAVLLLASLSIPGETTLTNMHHLQRGYERLLPNLVDLGADLELT